MQQPRRYPFVLRGPLLVIHGYCEGEQPGGYSKSEIIGTFTVQGNMVRRRAGS